MCLVELISEASCPLNLKHRKASSLYIHFLTKDVYSVNEIRVGDMCTDYLHSK